MTSNVITVKSYQQNHQMRNLAKIIETNAAAYNGRFGVMAAVPPQTILYGNERLYPAGGVVEAATTPSRWDVICNGRKNSGKRNRSNEDSDLNRLLILKLYIIWQIYL